jgi:hypothetical protein
MVNLTHFLDCVAVAGHLAAFGGWGGSITFAVYPAFYVAGGKGGGERGWKVAGPLLYYSAPFATLPLPFLFQSSGKDANNSTLIGAIMEFTCAG